MNIIKTNRRVRQSGTTLIELSVVIAVLLLLASVLFIGVQGWRDAANRSAAIVDISSIQKAVRGFENTNLLGPTDSCIASTDIAPYFNNNLPSDPSSGTAFGYASVCGTVGAIYATSANAATVAQLHNLNTSNW